MASLSSGPAFSPPNSTRMILGKNASEAAQNPPAQQGSTPTGRPPALPRLTFLARLRHGKTQSQSTANLAIVIHSHAIHSAAESLFTPGAFLRDRKSLFSVWTLKSMRRRGHRDSALHSPKHATRRLRDR